MADNNNNAVSDELESERFKDELDRDVKKWRIRRRMSITAFIYLLSVSVVYFYAGFTLSKEQMNVLTLTNPIQITIIGACVSMILTYFGTSYLDDKNKMEQGN
jgi:DMSO/TMAO reductase YedYZ heme-binding membrane subunit